MSEFQTSVQDLTAILRGSGKLELSTYAASPTWVDCGSLSGLEFSEDLEVSAEENDNADSDETVTNQTVTIKANLHEALAAPVWDILRGSFDTKTVTPASSQTSNQVFAAGSTSAGVIYEIEYKNSAGTEPTIAVDEDSDGNGSYDQSYVEDTDYRITKDAQNRYFIEFISGGSYTAANAIQVAVTHTPVASVKYVSGTASTLPWLMARITTANGSYTFYTICYKGKIKVGKKFTYPKDNDKDRRVKVPIEMTFKTDDTYHSGAIYETVQTGGLS